MTTLLDRVEIRTEEEADYIQIDEVLNLAFKRDDEAILIRHLRKNGGYIALVALDGDRVVGHVFFSPTPIQTGTGPILALSLAPVAVEPRYQGRGIGTLLINKGLELCKEEGHQIVIVLGHPGYYPRFGFITASSKGIKPPFTVPDEAFMIQELVEGALEGKKGVVLYPPEFEGV